MWKLDIVLHTEGDIKAVFKNENATVWPVKLQIDLGFSENVQTCMQHYLDP